MANRQNKFLIKRSNVAGKIPGPGDLLLGEMALNTADVKLFTSGTTANSILPIGWDRVSRTGDTMTGPLIINSTLNITGDTTLVTLPTNNNVATDILVRNSSTGIIEYRTSASLSGDTDTNFYVTGGTSDTGGTITLNLDGASSVSINNRTTKELNVLAFEGASITASPTYLTTTGTLVHAYAGGGGDDQEGAYNFSVPSDYVSGGSLYIKFMTVTTTSANVQFEMNVTSIDVGGDFSTATDTGLLQITQGSTAYNLIKTSEFTGGTATYSAGKNVSVYVHRDGNAGGDTYNNQDALLWGIVFEYTGIK